MARKPTFGGYKLSKSPKLKASAFRTATTKSSPGLSKQQDIPAPRRREFEEILCNAIANRKVVTFKYDDDWADRTFAPYAVFRSTKDKICVSGLQLNNPNQANSQPEPHTFEVGKIRNINISEETFNPDPQFNRHGPKYRKGIICSI